MPKLSSFLLAILVATISMSANAQGITTPRVPSPAASVSQTIGISTVTVNYSRPSVRGRQVWGVLVPYGWNKQGFGLNNDAPWRAGANENTVITFSHPATVEGQSVPAGSYGLFFVINPDNTGEMILSKDYRSWGSFFYDPKNDLIRAKIQIRDMPSSTEMLTYDFSNSDKNSSELDLNWEKKQFPVKISFAVDDIVLANAAEELKNTVGFTWMGFASAAGYAAQSKSHLDEGLIWANQAVTMNKNFNTLSAKSNVLTAMGNKAEADKTMNEAIPLSTENELNNYGYQLLAQNDFPRAIEILQTNTKRHPESPNVWDSLGEAYALSGDKKDAITSFKKSLSMNPPQNVRVNSEKYLKQLGAM